nr:MAG TPA: zinc-ribbon containing domain protein [Caudoviricetes sp.]
MKRIDWFNVITWFLLILISISFWALVIVHGLFLGVLIIVLTVIMFSLIKIKEK